MSRNEVMCGDNYIPIRFEDDEVRVVFQIKNEDYELYLAYMEEDPTVEITHSGKSGWHHIGGQIDEVEKYLLHIMNCCTKILSWHLFDDHRPRNKS